MSLQKTTASQAAMNASIDFECETSCDQTWQLTFTLFGLTCTCVPFGTTSPLMDKPIRSSTNSPTTLLIATTKRMCGRQSTTRFPLTKLSTTRIHIPILPKNR